MSVKFLIVLSNHYIDGLIDIKKIKSLKRQNRKAISYKITKEHLSYALEKLKENG